MIHPEAGIHPQAVVSGAKIDARTAVWQFASVIRGAIVGPECTISSCAIVDGARLGARCSVGHGAALFHGASCGDDVFIGPGAVICNDMWPSVEKDGFDIDRFGKGLVTVRIEDGASIGAAAVILPGVVIGKGAMVAAGALVDRSVPAASLFCRDGTIRSNFDRKAKAQLRIVPARC